MSQPPPDPNADLLHPIATEAATLYENAGKKFSPEALAKLERSLAALADDKMLGPASAPSSSSPRTSTKA